MLPLRNLVDVFEVPESPECYKINHPERIKKFPSQPRESFIVSTDRAAPQWRHELDHDSESVFWLLLYWAVGAQPEEEETEVIGASIWSSLMGPVAARVNMLQGDLDGATHSVFRPLWPLLNKLAAILNADGHWLKPSDPRKHPGYINEAFQRLILQFILDNRGKEFMVCKVGSELRRPEIITGLLPSSPTVQRR